MSPSHAEQGFTLTEFMIALLIGVLVILAVTSFYLPITRRALDQGAVSQQSFNQGINYALIRRHLSDAGFAIGVPTLDAHLLLYNGTDPVFMAAGGTFIGTKLLWSFSSAAPAGAAGAAADSCAGIEISGGELRIYPPIISAVCNAAVLTTYSVSLSNLTMATSNIQVRTDALCEPRDAAIAPAIDHPLVTLTLATAATLNEGFDTHNNNKTTPISMCLTNFQNA